MTDLSKKTPKQQQDDTPLGVMIMTLAPFAWLFWALIEWGLR